MKCGVPQESILSSLLFNMYIWGDLGWAVINILMAFSSFLFLSISERAVKVLEAVEN